MRALLLLISIYLIKSNEGAFCGTGTIPFRLEVLESGDFVLGCATPTCLCVSNGGSDAQFNVCS